MIRNRICILGTGAWATALGMILSKNNNTIFMWGINPKEINDINSGYNKTYFKEKKFVSSLSATDDMRIAIGNSKYIILAVPSFAIIDVINKLKQNVSPKNNLVLINVIKGLDETTSKPISHTIRKMLKGYKIKVVTICGPSYAYEVYYERPTIVNASSNSFKLTKSVSELFNSPIFKVIPTRDEKGLQIYAAIKNLLAIGIGVAHAHYESTNTVSAMLTIGINEMAIIGKKMGAKKRTILNFCGIGDVILTCSSTQSRNFSFGKTIFEKGVIEAIKENKSTVEGYQVYKTIKKIIKENGLKCPLFSMIILMLEAKIQPHDFVTRIWELIYKNNFFIN